MPVPYMGSKRGSASKIVSVMRLYQPQATTVYDVFCGGFAISEELIKRGYNVHASDLNTAVVNLIHETLYGDCKDPQTNDSIFEHPRFIHRDEFEARNNDDDWFAGYVKCIWSFGNNNNKGYLYSPENERLKEAAHNLVVDGVMSDELPVPKIVQKQIVNYKTSQGRRKALGYYARAKHAEYRSIELERLRSLENLQRLRSLENLSYDEVDIEPGAIIYCDPPYIGTAGYIANDTTFDHQKFYDWCREKAKTNPVFVSEYHCPSDFKNIYEFERRQTLSKGETKYNEKLFYLNRLVEE